MTIIHHKDSFMKILLILMSVASSLSQFGNLRRNGFFNHHRAGNNFRRPSQSSPNGLRQKKDNKSEQPLFSHQEVINEWLMYNSLLPMLPFATPFTFSEYILQQYDTRHENQLST